MKTMKQKLKERRVKFSRICGKEDIFVVKNKKSPQKCILSSPLQTEGA
jgi:hypothetical protein